MDLKNERLAYIVLREYLSQAYVIHTAQKFQNEQGRPRIKCLCTNNRTPLTAKKYLLYASSFEAHEALVCCGAAVSLSHT